MHTPIKNNISWVGYVDWTLRDFHGYDTPRGGTYNSYLIQDEKIVLVDAVKGLYVSSLLENIAELVPLEKVDYVVCNHAELDHSSGLPVVMRKLPNAVLVCNARCQKTLSAYYDTTGWRWKIVEDGEKLEIGRRTLEFHFTPMVHWPESMFTYVPEEKLLFSMDAFGQHLASSERFDEEILDEALREAKTYYANIVMPYPKQVLKTLEMASKLDLETVCPSHGVVWRKHLPEIVEAYSRWASGRVEPKVLILYDTMWESTTMLAKAIYAGVLDVPGATAQLFSIRTCTLADLVTAASDAGCCAIGSSTQNAVQMPMVSAVMTYFQGLKPPVKHALAFGSYGWGRGAAEEITAWFERVKWEPVCEPVKCIYRPDDAALAAARAAGKLLGEKAVEMAKE